MPKKLCLVAALALATLAGCASNTTFVYKPPAPASGVRRLPTKVAVVAFRDGTEDFTRRGSLFEPEIVRFNLAKGVMGGWITALTPELWAKSFADDLAASGAFQAVRFYFNPSELKDEDFHVEGTVERATAALPLFGSTDFTLSFRALRKADNKMIWEKRVTRVWSTPTTIFDGCGMGVPCKLGRYHANVNRVMQGIFAEAGTDLGAALPVSSGSWGGEVGSSPVASPASLTPESAEETIEGIIGGKR